MFCDANKPGLLINFNSFAIAEIAIIALNKKLTIYKQIEKYYLKIISKPTIPLNSGDASV